MVIRMSRVSPPLRWLASWAAAALLIAALPHVLLDGTARAAVPKQTGDLYQLVNDMVSGMPRSGSEAYVRPSSTQLSKISNAVGKMLDGKTSRAAQVAASVGLEVVEFHDAPAGVDLIVLRENAASGLRGWGMFVLSPASVSDVSVEAPHPLADLNTEDLGVDVFRSANAKTLLVAGTHRRANADGSSDAAHAPSSFFQAAHDRALDDVAHVVQVHGFSHAKHPDLGDAVASSGTAPPAPTVLDVAHEFELVGMDTCVYDGHHCSELAGTTNVQGISTRNAGDEFVHVELTYEARSTGASVTTGALSAAID